MSELTTLKATEQTDRDGSRFRSKRRFAPDPKLVGEEAALRLGLQRRSASNLRRQLERALVRMVVLVVADISAFIMMRGLLRALRDEALMGSALAGQLAVMMPRGYLSGWQFAAALLIGLLVTGNYGQGDRRRDPSRLFVGSALAVALPLWMALWTRGVGMVMVQYVLTTLLVWTGLVMERRILDRVVAFFRPPSAQALRTLLVGPYERCTEAMRLPVFQGTEDYRVVGIVDSNAVPARDALGSVNDLVRHLHATDAECVVICGFLREGQFERVVDTSLSAGCELVAIPRSLRLGGVKPTLIWRGGEPLVALSAPSLKAQQLVVKRIVDVVGAGLGLLILSPLFALIATAIRIESRGPVIFRQQRVGFGGRPFGMLKFRTMVEDAEQRQAEVKDQSIYADARLFKVVNDPRVTRLGRVLRRFSLDELPQLWNVLVGEMSLVGPRPPVPSEVALYELHHFDRLGAKPGMTGLWQVSGRNNVTDFEEVVRFDREYIDRWSLGLDVSILLRTVPTVISRRGAF